MEKLRLTKESLSKILDRHQNWAKSSDYYKKESDRADLSGIDLTNVPENMYRDKYLCGIIFNNSDMSGMNLFNKNMKGVWLNGACLRGTNLHSARLDESALYDTDFTDANLSTASIRQPRINAGTNFRRSCLFGTVISEPRIWHEKERTIRFLRALMWSAVVFMVACVIMHLLTKNPESFDLYLESAGIAFFMIVAAVYKWLTWTDPASITWRDICLYKKYCNWAGVNQRISINDIIAQRNISREKALEEINYLKRKKYISESGYDAQKGILQTFVYDDSETVEKSDTPVEKPKDSKSIFQKHLAALEKTDVENTGGITEDVNRLKETVSKAEAHAAEYPDDGKKISSAVDRYASMAEEMVAVYSRLDRLEADGENATAIRESVKQGLKEINDALDKILDDLFSYERMDVEASVSAAETMMKADGAVKE